MTGQTPATVAAATQQQNQQPMNENAPQINLQQILQSVLGGMPGTIPVTSTGSSPGSYIPPVQKQTAPMTSAGGGEYHSRGAANMASASNLFGNVASAINTAKQNSDAQKARKLAIDVERVYTAQAGIEQARQTLQTNPNDPQAKAMLDKNTQLINDMLADPKKRKELEEAFNYSFIGDDKKSGSWQRQAGKMGAQTYQQQLEKQMPTTTSVNPTAVAQNKANTESVKAMMPAISAMIRAAGQSSDTAQRTQTQRDIAQAKIQQDSENAWLRYQAEENRTAAQDRRTAMLGAAEKQRFTLMFQRNAMMAQQMEQKIGEDGVKNILASTKQQTSFLTDQLKSINSRMNALEGRNDPKKNPQGAAEYQLLQQQRDQLQLKIQDQNAKVAAINSVMSGGKPAGALTTTTTGPQNGKSGSTTSRTDNVINAAGTSQDDDEEDDDQ